MAPPTKQPEVWQNLKNAKAAGSCANGIVVDDKLLFCQLCGTR